MILKTRDQFILKLNYAFAIAASNSRAEYNVPKCDLGQNSCPMPLVSDNKIREKTLLVYLVQCCCREDLYRSVQLSAIHFFSGIQARALIRFDNRICENNQDYHLLWKDCVNHVTKQIQI